MPEITDDEIAAKIVSDPRYFIERCLSIIDPDLQRVPFIFNPIQSKFYEARTDRDMVTKARKPGISALVSAIFLHSCMFVPNTRAVIISDEEGATKRLFRRVRDYLDKSVLSARIKRESDNEIWFTETNSWFYAGTAGSKTFGRGDDITHIHFSEYAHYPRYDIITGAMEALVKGAKTWAVMETTQRGAGTQAHESWLRAIGGESGWKPHFFGWQEDPWNIVRGATPVELSDEEKSLKESLSLSWEQIAWRRKKLSEMEDPTLFPQEYPATWEEAFLASGRMVFDWQAIKRQEESIQPSKWRGHIVDRGSEVGINPDPRGPLTVWRTHDPQLKYLIVCDAADGIVGAAFSVADVYDMRSWEQVAQWRGHVDPAEFGNIAMRLGAFYGWALIAVENNYPGNATLQKISDGGYPNIYDEPDEAGDKLGWMTTVSSRAQFIADGREALKDGSLRINSKATLNECRTFVLTDKNTMAAQQGCFQDTVIVMCKAANILKHHHFSDLQERRKSFRDVMGLARRRSYSSGQNGNYQTRVV